MSGIEGVCLTFYYYRIFNGHLNKPHLEAVRDPILLPRQHLMESAGRQWNGNLITLNPYGRILVFTRCKWKSCPIQFTPAELDGFFRTGRVVVQLE